MKYCFKISGIDVSWGVISNVRSCLSADTQMDLYVLTALKLPVRTHQRNW